MKPLTEKQRSILDFIKAKIRKSGVAPTFNEIQKQFNFSSTATVHDHLKALEKKEAIIRTKECSRSITVLEKNSSTPLIGEVSLQNMSLYQESIEIPYASLPGSYALKVADNSFHEEMILSGDLLIIDANATEGSYALCLIQGFGTLIKKISYFEEQIHLASINENIDPIKMGREYVDVQGRILKLLRDF